LLLLALTACGGTVSDAPGAPDPAADVLASISACDPAAAAPPATGRERDLRELRAYLDGAELGRLATEPRPTVDAALLARGTQLYNDHCVECHGDRADGKGPRAAKLSEAPRDHSAGVYELRSTETGSLPTDDDLFHTISHGVHGTAMPPWLLLPERDRWALVAHLKALSPAFADDEAPAPLEIGAPPPVTPALLARGKELFGTAGCASCHGAKGKGDGEASGALRMMNGDPAHPRDFTGIHFHRGSDVTDIYRSLATGLDGTPMASFARVMPPEDMWAVASYVHSLSPPYVAGPDGIRCPSKPAANAEELIGIRTELRTIRSP
jgi:cytochrome c oxidase cbb3-type subunit 2